MELVVGTNSYITLEEANSIVSNEYFSDDEEYKIWSSLSDEDKIKLVIKGTRIIEKQIWLGYKINGWGMSWPRNIQGKRVECPDDVKSALLINILQDSKYSKTKEQQLQDLGVASYKVKDASISFVSSPGNTGNSKTDGIYTNVYATYLSKWLR